MTNTQAKSNRLQTEFQKGGINGVARWAGRWLYWNASLYRLSPTELRRTYKKLKPHKKFNINAPILVYQMGKVGSTSVAKASAAAILCESVIFCTLLSSAPRKIPGNPRELLT